MMRWSNGWMVMAGVMIAPAGIATAEDITLTTYYPSPRGVYQQLRVGDAAAMAGSTSALHVVQLAGADAVRVDDSLGDTSPFVIDFSGRVGIGVATPSLSYVEVVNATGFRSFQVNDEAADATPFVITDTGNVGIGVAAPANKLRIVGSGGTNVDLRVDGRIRTGDTANQGGVWLGDANEFFVGRQDANRAGFWTNGAGVGWNALSINRATGNVGIGTTTPTQRLDIDGGNLIVQGAGSFDAAGETATAFLGDANNWVRTTFGGLTEVTGFNGFRVRAGSPPTELLRADIPAGVQTVTVNGKLHVQGDAAIDQNLGVGVAPPGLFNARLIVGGGPIHSTHNRFYFTGSDGVTMAWIMGAGGQEETGVQNDGDNIIGWSQNGTIMGRTIRMLGHVEVGGQPYATGLEVWGPITNPSDIRLKTNIAPLSGVLGRLDHVRGVSYQLKHDEHLLPAEAARRQLGFIAQEMEGAFPELVYTNTEGILSIDYVKFVPVLLEAVKELKAENDELTQRVEALERRAP